MTIKNIPMLDMNDPDFAVKFKAVIGLADGETLQIMTPQFERTDGIVPATNPTGLFGMLRTLPKETLIALGMGNWNGCIYLFPYQWFSKIPKGMKVIDISGKWKEFDPETFDDDYRAGCLAYGIVPDFAKDTPEVDD